MIEVTVAHLGLDRTTNTPVVILREKEGSRVLPIWIGPAEASAIAMELQGMKAQRPLTHELLDQSGVETDEPSPNPSLEADKLKDYLEKMDPQDFGKFNP